MKAAFALCDELEAKQTQKRQARTRLNEACLDRLLTAQTPDEFAEHWQRIHDNFDLLYDSSDEVGRFRQATLELGMQGRLVRQSSKDEPAKRLLEGIATHRQESAKAGKRGAKRTVKSETPPYTVPSGWEWCRVDEIATVKLGGTPARANPTFWGGSVPWVSSGEVANCRINITRETISNDGLENSNAKFYPEGTVLIAMIGQGKTRGQSAILDVPATTNQNVAGLTFESGNIDPEYVWKWALCEYERTRSGGRGGAQPALNGAKIRALLLPLPPPAEQRRIVAALDELLQMCDELESRLRRRQRSSADLLASLIAHLSASTAPDATLAREATA